MSIVTLDASVICKWFQRGSDEADLAEADALADAVASGQLRLVQPPHWLAEVLGVVARQSGGRASAILAQLLELDVQVDDASGVYQIAVGLAQRIDAHVFDTLYHAVAIAAPSGRLITADVRYFTKAQQFGRIELLGMPRSRVQETRPPYAAASAVGADMPHLRRAV